MKKLLAPVLLACLLYSSCSPALSIRVNEDRSGSFAFRSDLGAVLNSTLNSLSGGGSLVFDRAKIGQTLQSAGLRAGPIEADSTKLVIEAAFKDLHTLLPADVQFMSVQKDGETSVLHLLLSADAVREALKLVPEDTAAYAELLMAPVFTGEEMTIPEYIDLIALAYGAKPAEELKKSAITVSITSPKTVQTAAASRSEVSVRFSKNTAIFTMPLAFFLTNTAPSEYTVRW